MIVVEALSVMRQDRAILKDAWFSLHAGEFCSLIGPNGAGKSTMLRVLARLITPQKGSVTLQGQPLSQVSSRQLATMLAYVPQVDNGQIQCTVADFAVMARYARAPLLGTYGREDWDRVDWALGYMGVSHFAQRSMNTLSGGERQAVVIAAALAQDTPILLLDEPASFLDPKHQTELHAALMRIHRELGKTILLVTHDLNRALWHTERVLAMQGGMLVFDGPAERLANRELLKTIYGTSFVIGTHPGAGRPMILPELPA